MRSGHVTLLERNFNSTSPKLCPQSDLQRPVAARLALPNICSFFGKLLLYHHRHLLHECYQQQQ